MCTACALQMLFFHRPHPASIAWFPPQLPLAPPSALFGGIWGTCLHCLSLFVQSQVGGGGGAWLQGALGDAGPGGPKVFGEALLACVLGCVWGLGVFFATVCVCVCLCV